MRAFVRFQAPDGKTVDVDPGGLIGRLPTAAFCVDDPRISEAHALVSVRRGEVMLLSLRRLFAVRGKPVAEVALEAGMDVELAPGLVVRVQEVHGPTTVLAIEAAALGRRVLPGTASLMAGKPPQLLPRFEPDAALHIWWNGDGWRACAGELVPAQARTVADGTRVRVAGLDVRFVAVALTGTVTTSGGLMDEPLRMIAWYDSVEIHRHGQAEIVVIAGIGARILSELIVFEGPVEWQVLANEVWSDTGGDPAELRHRWDAALARLRAKLKESGVRPDLVRSTGAGFVQLVRRPADVFENRS